MRAPTGVDLRCEHAIRQDALLRQCEVGSGLTLLDVGVGGVRRRRAIREPDQVEAVHLAAVELGQEIDLVVVGIVAGEDPGRLELHGRARAGHAARRRVGAGIAVEEVIEAAILLNDEDHVLETAGSSEGS